MTVISVHPETDHIQNMSLEQAEAEILRLNGGKKAASWWAEKHAGVSMKHPKYGYWLKERHICQHSSFESCANTYDQRTGSCTGQRSYRVMSQNVVAKMPDGVFMLWKVGERICSPDFEIYKPE